MEVTQRSQMVLQQIVEEKTAENFPGSDSKCRLEDYTKTMTLLAITATKNHYIRLNNFLEFHFLPRGNLARQQCCDLRVPVVTLT